MFDTTAANVILHSKTEQLCSAESMELRSQRFIRLKLPKKKRAPAPYVQFHALETLSLSGYSVDLVVLLPRYPCLRLIRFDVTPFLDKVPAASYDVDLPCFHRVESMELRSQRFICLKLPKQKRAPVPSVQFL
jgi:hypothetical protein